MEHKIYRGEYSDQPRPHHEYSDGVHIHIEYFDIGHTRDLQDFKELLIPELSDSLFPSQDTTIRKKREWIYKDGDEEGLFIRYNYNGDKVKEVKTPRYGEWKEYNNEKLEYIIPFKNGLKHGEEIFYNDDENKRWVKTWYEGFEHGPFISFFDDGRELSRENWNKGELEGG